MGPNLRPPERAIGKSRQEGDGVRNISLSPQQNPEGRVLRRNDGASFWIVADALTTGEPSLRRRVRVYARRRLQAFGQAGSAIVVAHAIKCIGHCCVPHCLEARFRTASRECLFAIMSTGYD